MNCNDSLQVMLNVVSQLEQSRISRVQIGWVQALGAHGEPETLPQLTIDMKDDK